MHYVLGSDDPEVKRLDLQAGWLEEPTRLLLRLAGIERGMRVLDLGTGLGHVALAVADLVGRDGRVVAIDSDDRMLALATERAGDRTCVQFLEGDVRTWTCDERFDAVVGRLILFHLPDPVAAVRHHRAHLRAGGRFVAVDYDIGSCRTEPPTPLVEDHARRVIAAFRSAGANPVEQQRVRPAPLVEQLAALMRRLAERLEQEDALFRHRGIDPPATELARDPGVVPVGSVAAQR